ncbi:unnamed protein product [Sympodiomycopsis kandeliae]
MKKGVSPSQLESNQEKDIASQGLHPEIGDHSRPYRTFTMRTLTVLVALSLICACGLVSLINGAPQSSFHSRAERPKSWQGPAEFPRDAFKKYYTEPGGFDHEPRPVIQNIAKGEPYPNSLDDPWQLPDLPPQDEAVYPKPVGGPAPDNLLQDTIDNITSIIKSNEGDKCSRCTSAVPVFQRLARLSPKDGPKALLALCKQNNYLGSDDACEKQYAPAVLGAQLTQIGSYVNLKEGESDAQAVCSMILKLCPIPAPRNFTDAYLDKWFEGKGGRTAPASHSKHHGRTKHSRGKTLRMLHMSDIHLDPRFLVGSEAKCTNGQCCRADAFNSTKASGPSKVPHTLLNASSIVEPAEYWGNYLCDSPYSITLSAFQSVKPLNGGKDVDLTVYTGDIVTHDADNHLSRDFVTQGEQAVYDIMKKYLGNGPVFSTLGNHDSSPSDSSSSDSLPDGHDTFSWNYDYLSKLWQAKGWFTHDEAKQVGKHYGGYSVSPTKGLRMISINTDFMYINNKWNVIEYNNPDLSGTFSWLTKELYLAEKRGEKVYLIGHVSPGWDGTNAMDNPTSLLAEIIQRYRKTISHMFFGHSHEDFFSVFYNGTKHTADNAIAHAFVGPSITPKSRVNPSFGIYTLDAESFEVLDHDVYYTDIHEAKSLVERGVGPVWKHLYSARQAYNDFSASVQNKSYAGGVPLDNGKTWPKDAPLNATFFASLTTEMLLRPELVQTFTKFQGRNSYLSPDCTSKECVEAKVCYLQSGTTLLGKQCPRGFNSVQPGNGKG